MLTCLSVASVQVEMCSISTRKIGIDLINTFFIILNKCGLFNSKQKRDGFRTDLLPKCMHSMRRVYKNLCPTTISASIMAANMWKNSLKNVESDNNKILYETLLDFFTAKRHLLSEQDSYLSLPRNAS